MIVKFADYTAVVGRMANVSSVIHEAAASLSLSIHTQFFFFYIKRFINNSTAAFSNGRKVGRGFQIPF